MTCIPRGHVRTGLLCRTVAAVHSLDACAVLAPSTGTGTTSDESQPRHLPSGTRPCGPNDPLYKEISSGTSGLQYFLGHHTFSHENLNNVTYQDAYLQIRLNQVRVLLVAHVIALFACC